MKHLRITLLAIAALLMVLPVCAQNNGKTWYVSQTTGNNRNDGSKANPVKNIQKAVDMASTGDVIYVAEGNYYGLLNSGNIKINKGVSIFGGWSSDFSERDILGHRTYIQPTATSNGSAQAQRRAAAMRIGRCRRLRW